MTVTSAQTRDVIVDRLTWTPDGRREPTLRDVSLRIPHGARVALLGASGAGKSTLLKALAGVLEESGTGTIRGSMRVPQAGLLLQDPHDAIVADTVGRDVAFGPENDALTRPEIWRRVDSALADVAFPFGPDRSTMALSGGQMQRLTLAGALATQPSLLLLDEPTAMLDAEAATGIRSAVRDTVDRNGATLVVVEHRIGPWLDLLDHAVLLGRGGQVLASGEIHDVLARHRDDVLGAGTWLPDAASPAPVPLPAGAVAPVGAGTPLVSRGAALRRGAHLVGGADLEIHGGSVTALTGPSGSGKSTTLHLLVGLETPDSGSVDPATSELASDALACEIAYVAQHPSLSFVAHSVRDEMLVTPLALGRDSDSRADLLLEHFGLSHLASASPYSLSGGEQRRLSLAASLMAGPRVLALDEPSIGQDRHTWALVAGTVTSGADAGVGVVMATHDVDLAALADRTVAVAMPTAADEAGATPATRRVAGCRPLALLAAGLAAALAALFISTPVGAVVAVLGMLLLLPTFAPAPSVLLARSLPVLVAAVSVGWSSWLLGGRDLVVAAVAVARIFCMVLPGILLMAHIRPSQLGDDLGQRLRLPARTVVACVVALQRLEHLRDVWRQLAHNRRIRGLEPTRSAIAGRVKSAAALTFSLLVESLRAANVTSVAMDARGFSKARRRTWAETSNWRHRDTVVVLVALTYGAVVVATNLFLG